MGYVGAARFLFLASCFCVAAIQLIEAQGSDSYTTLLNEVKKWQAENPTECGLDTPTCGINKMQDNFQSCSAFRVVNGCPVEKPLTIGWTVGLSLGNEMCSGTMVSPQHVLLAAHCVENDPPVNKMRVFIGEPNMRNAQKFSTVSAYAFDPDFNPETVNRDVAIIKLSKPISLQSGAGGVRVACLPVGGPAPLSTTARGQCLIAGFGINDFRGRGSGEGVMRYTMLKIQNPQVCKNTYRNQFNQATMFCAVGQRQGLGTDSCDGDSGSSVLCKDSTGRWAIAGIVSFGAKNCGQIPGVYADAHKLGLTVSNPRQPANQKCKSASDNSNNKQPEVAAAITPVKPPQKPSTGGSGTTTKRPGGTSTTIEATKKEHGCDADDQCQTNICRFVALCVQEKQEKAGRNGGGGFMNIFNFFGRRSTEVDGQHNPYRALTMPGNFSGLMIPELDPRGLGSAIMKPIIKLGSVINMGTADDIHKRFFGWRLTSSVFGSLFTKRKCEMASICWNKEWTVIPTIPVAMFEE